MLSVIMSCSEISQRRLNKYSTSRGFCPKTITYSAFSFFKDRTNSYHIFIIKYIWALYFSFYFLYSHSHTYPHISKIYECTLLKSLTTSNMSCKLRSTFFLTFLSRIFFRELIFKVIIPIIFYLIFGSIKMGLYYFIFSVNLSKRVKCVIKLGILLLLLS